MVERYGATDKVNAPLTAAKASPPGRASRPPVLRGVVAKGVRPPGPNAPYQGMQGGQGGDRPDTSLLEGHVAPVAPKGYFYVA